MNIKFSFLVLILATLTLACKNDSASTHATVTKQISRAESNSIALMDGSKITLNADKVYYLVRHAEKVKDGNPNPNLTIQGKDRALLLSDILRSAQLDKVFVTMTNRTIQTADTLVRTQKMNMITYDGKKLDEFSAKLKSDNSFKSALIVGHSNTTPTLAGLLSGKQFPAIPESGYDDIYVVIIRNGESEIHTLKYNRA